MSQLQQASSSSGKPEQFTKLDWPDFVQLALRLTIKAYQAMRQEVMAQLDWEENHFTIRLGEDYLRPITFDNELPLRVDIRSKVHTKEMKEGKQATIEAKEMDLSLYGVWERDYLRKRFVWEAKRVGDKRANSKYSSLNSEYVNEALYRFIRREYADGLDDAGVLAYILAGQADIIVNDINHTMGNLRNNPALPQSNHLRKNPLVNNFTNIFLSQHIRTDNTNIQLHHLFLTFDFAP